ncbi:MAG: MlaE family ABC transporter permease [Bdellovibrionales bacterium]
MSFQMVMEPIDHLGKRTLMLFSYTFRVFAMVYFSIRSVALDPSQGFRAIFSVISAQIYYTGWQALPLISILAAASGGIVVMQSSLQLAKLGGVALLGQVLVAVIIREIGPLLTALFVIARSGTAVATELGNMKVNRETEALEAMGVDPLSYVVFPRLAGGVISVVCLGIYFVLIALLGGYVVVNLGAQSMPFSFYYDTLAQAITFEDVILFLIKISFSGVIIFVIACYQGLLVRNSPHEVPQVTTKAVVNSILYVMSFNLLITFFSYLGKLQMLGVI